MDFKKNLKCFTGSMILITPICLIFKAPSWAFGIGIVLCYLLFCIIQEIDDLKEKIN